MKLRPNGPCQQALTEAAEWYVRLGEGDVSPQERRAFENWLQADDNHIQALGEIEATWNTLAGAQCPGARQVLERTHREERREMRRLLSWGGGLLLLLLTVLPLAWQVMGIAPPDHLLADHYTQVGKHKSVELPDGSLLLLNTATAVDLRFDDRRRRILLHEGEIFLVVALDPARPLEVITPEARTQALGTRFSVRRLEGTITRVTVHESRVKLCPRDDRDHCRRLEPGQQARAIAGQVAPPVAVAPRDAPAWVSSRLEVEDRPVAAVLAELARYHRGLLHYDASALAGMRVSGVLPLDDLDRALNALAATLPIRIDRYTPWLVLVSPGP